MKAPLRSGHVVLTPDGRRCIVRWVDQRDGEARVAPEDSSDWEHDSMTLPVTELKRVARRPLPPVDGQPDIRPRCQWCDRPLKASVTQERSPSVPAVVTKRTFHSWCGYGWVTNITPLFCTHGCAGNFARASWLGGYRRQKAPK